MELVQSRPGTRSTTVADEHGGADPVRLFEAVVRHRLALLGVSDCDPLLTIDGALLDTALVAGAGDQRWLTFRASLSVADAATKNTIISLALQHKGRLAGAGQQALEDAWVRTFDSLSKPIRRIAEAVQNWRRDSLFRHAGRPSTEGAKSQASPEHRVAADDRINRGSCAVVRPDGAVLTAYHVVSGAQTIWVRLADGRALRASVARVDARHDLALLKIAARSLPYLPLAYPEKDQLGARVFTIGFPAVDLLGQQPRFTEGSISALCGPLATPDLLQVSVPLQPGNSGGPLVNHAGELQGVISSIAAADRFERATGALPQRVNFAVKVRHVRGMYATPPAPPPAVGREEAIRRARRAACSVEALTATTPEQRS